MGTKGGTKDTIGDRFKVTKNGKILRRSMGVGHFRTRKSSKNLVNKRTRKGLAGVTAQTLKAY